MSAAGAAHLKAELEESLQHFFTFERMGTEINSLIRAVYKEMRQEGDYAKGKGKREFAPLLKAHHAGPLFIFLSSAPTAGAGISTLTARSRYTSTAVSWSLSSRTWYFSSSTPTFWRTFCG
eukprot:762964-Pleurochrysis_carterae.AAC.1